MKRGHRLQKRERKVKSTEPLLCTLCNMNISRAKNLKKHLGRKHEEFLKIRCKVEHTEMREALNRTEINHIKIGDQIPRNIMDTYLKGTHITYYFKPSATGTKDADLRTVPDKHEISTVDDATSASAAVSDVESEAIVDEPTTVAVDTSSSAADVPTSSVANVPTSSTTAVTITSTSESLAAAGSETTAVVETELASTKSVPRQSTLLSKCSACAEMEVAISITKATIEFSKKQCHEIIEKHCVCKSRTDCCCIKTLQWLTCHEVDQIEQEEKEIDLISGPLEEEFFSRIVHGKRRHFCVKCHRYNPRKHSGPGENDFIIKGTYPSSLTEIRYLKKEALEH